MKADIVIIGASHAGVSFVDAMRTNGFAGSLMLIDRQTGTPMERPPLSKAYLLEDEDSVNPAFMLRNADWYEANDVKLKSGADVTAIDAVAKTLTLADGSTVGFDKLVLATGAVPRALEPASGLGNVFMLRQPDDAVALRQSAQSAQSAIIIGGGYIGLEVAASLRKRGLDVSVIEAADRLLARVASPPVAALLGDLHHAHGVSIHTGVAVAGIHDDKAGGFAGISLTDGRALSADMLVVGIGVTPDSQLARMAHIETEDADNGAILVDHMMRTSNPDILAIGDVALQRGHALRIESVHNAQDNAARAVAGLLDVPPPADQAPWFWSDQYDAKLQSAGIVPVGADDLLHISRPGKREGGMSVWTYRNNRLLAVEAVRDPAGYMLGKKCLEADISPDPDQIGDPAFDLKALLAH